MSIAAVQSSMEIASKRESSASSAEEQIENGGVELTSPNTESRRGSMQLHSEGNRAVSQSTRWTVTKRVVVSTLTVAGSTGVGVGFGAALRQGSVSYTNSMLLGGGLACMLALIAVIFANVRSRYQRI